MALCYWCFAEATTTGDDPLDNGLTRPIASPLWTWMQCETCGTHLFDAQGIPYCGTDLNADQRFTNCWQASRCWICAKHETDQAEHPRSVGRRRVTKMTPRSELL